VTAAPPFEPPDLPLTFREELAPHVYAAVRGGFSVALVGVAGGGLSNALRFLARPAVAAYYLGEAAAGTLPVFVEADQWRDPAAVFRELVRAVLVEARAQHWPRAEQAGLRAAAEAALTSLWPDGGTPLTEVLDYFCAERHRRLLFLCDEFDSALTRLPAAVLRTLRALRDAHKFRVSYVLGLRREPGLLAAARAPDDNGPDPAKFVELFDEHTFPVRPYTPADARVAVARKTLDWSPPIDPEQAETLYRVTGGHARLLTTSLIHLSTRRHLTWGAIEPGLMADPAILAPCSAIWNDLSPAEQRAAWLLAREDRSALDEAGLAPLRLRGLAVGGPPFLFSSLFEAFVSKLPEPPAPPPTGLIPRLRDPAAQPLW
jgi:hypothetical protein